MKKFILASAFLIALGACAIFEADTLRQKVFAMGADYNAVLSVALEYESLPRCPEGVGSDEEACSEVSVVAEIRLRAQEVEIVLDTLERLAQDHTTTHYTLTTAIDVARRAIDALEQVLAVEGIV